MFKHLALILLLFAVPCAALADGDRSVTLDLGRSSASGARGHSELDIYRVGLRWDWQRTLWQGQNADLGGYWEASLNLWDSAVDDVTTLAFSPVFVLELGDRNARYRPYIEAGVGLAVLSDDTVGGRRLGSSWQFEDRIGFGFASDRFDFHYRFMHYSNGDIESPNQGIDAHVIGINIRY